MEESQINFSLFFSILLLFPIDHEGSMVNAAGSASGSANGYVEVREGAYMFWSYYQSPSKALYPGQQWPLILWLQGGPGSSAFGFGNFGEIGPLDEDLNTRNSTWLRVADLLFVDSPVGTGFSYVKNQSLLVETDAAAAVDLTTLLVSLSKDYDFLNTSPLYIVGESYGGKIAVQLGLEVIEAIEGGELNITLGGVAFGNPWISPFDSISSWAPLLNVISRLENDDLVEANIIVEGINQQLKSGKFADAAYNASSYRANISNWSHSVNFYNFLLQENTTSTDASSSKFDCNLTTLMNDEIKKEISIIPESVVWKEQSESVYTSMRGDYMKHKVKQVDQLLAKGVNVSVYSGQLDLISSTMGTDAWVKRLKWPELSSFLAEDRIGFGCMNYEQIKGYRRIYKNFVYFWILNAGHHAARDQPYIVLRMIARLTQSPAFAEELCIPL